MERTTIRAGALGGQPRKEPPADAASLVRDLAADGWSIVGVAFRFGVAENTLRRWFTDHPQLQEAFARGREKERHTLHNRLYRIAVESDDEKAASIACMFLLKSRHGYREGDPVDAGNRISVTFQLPGALSPQDYLKTVNDERTVEAVSIPATSATDSRDR